MVEQRADSQEHESENYEHNNPKRAQEIFYFYSSSFQFIPNLEEIDLKETTRNGLSFQLSTRMIREGKITRIDIKVPNHT